MFSVLTHDLGGHVAVKMLSLPVHQGEEVEPEVMSLEISFQCVSSHTSFVPSDFWIQLEALIHVHEGCRKQHYDGQ